MRRRTRTSAATACPVAGHFPVPAFWCLSTVSGCWSRPRTAGCQSQTGQAQVPARVAQQRNPTESKPSIVIRTVPDAVVSEQSTQMAKAEYGKMAMQGRMAGMETKDARKAQSNHRGFSPVPPSWWCCELRCSWFLRDGDGSYLDARDDEEKKAWCWCRLPRGQQAVDERMKW